MIDIDKQISAVQRHIGTRKLEAGEAYVLTVAQTYDTSVENLWDACTSAERIGRWFLPVSGDLRPGGTYQIEGNANGTIERCDPPQRFAATWEYDGDVSWIEVEVTADPQGGARFRLEHLAHVDDERWAEFGPGAVGVGWDMGVMGLALHLSSAAGHAADPQESAAWAASDEGREFMTRSSNAWRDANIALGTDAAVATAAADRTTAAYTAAPPAE